MLSERQREIKTMVFERNCSYRQVAEWLDIAYATVNEHVKRIREKHAKAGEPLPDKRRHFITQ